MGNNLGTHILRPKEVKQIKYKNRLLSFLRNPKDKHIVWMFSAYTEYPIHRTGGIQDFYSDLDSETLELKFDGRWSTYEN